MKLALCQNPAGLVPVPDRPHHSCQDFVQPKLHYKLGQRLKAAFLEHRKRGSQPAARRNTAPCARTGEHAPHWLLRNFGCFSNQDRRFLVEQSRDCSQFRSCVPTPTSQGLLSIRGRTTTGATKETGPLLLHATIVVTPSVRAAGTLRITPLAVAHLADANTHLAPPTHRKQALSSTHLG